MKIYAVVSKETDNVIAQFLDHGTEKVKFNGIKLGILDQQVHPDERELLKVVEVYLSSSKGKMDQTKQLDPDTFIVESLSYYEEVDFVYLSRNPERDIALCTPKE